MEKCLIIGEYLDHELELVLLPEILEGALLQLLPGDYTPFNLVDSLHKEFLHRARLRNHLRVESNQLPVLPFELANLFLQFVGLDRGLGVGQHLGFLGLVG